jgi:polysaccharide export outer membrane protein
MFRLFHLFAAFFSVFFAASAFANEAVEPYTLRHGDNILVSVWREEALQKEVKVLPDGSITFPLAGRVEVAGLNSTEVEKVVAERLKEYIPDPVVTIVITGIEGSRVYILGKVLKPGPVLLNMPTTVMQALSQAGGLDKFADGDAIKVLRVSGASQKTFPVPYGDLIKGRELGSNLLLKAGDTILVP